LIVLFTDFGLHGPYTGQMKAVLHQMAPRTPVVDLFSDAPAGNPKPSTIVRPGLLTNRPATGRCRVLPALKDWRFGMVSRADVGDFLVRQVDDRAMLGTTPLLIS
jgi:hypothetical protein